MLSKEAIDLDYIVEGALKAISSIDNFIRRAINRNINKSFSAIEHIGGNRRKRMLLVDALAENAAEDELERKLKFYQLVTLGEESLIDETLDLSREERIVVIMDIIDGTDLLERGLFNWCSAMAFYYPPEKKILASFVARADDNLIYFARDDRDKAFKYPLHGKDELIELVGPSDVRSLQEASIAFYGQKVPNFISIAENKKFLSCLNNLHKQKARSLKTRIYNLAGNPIMMRVIDGYSRIDAVFDLEGQAPHDVVPGAYIAQKANAIFTDIQGNHIDLGEALLRPADPNSRISYILASTEELSKELQGLFSC